MSNEATAVRSATWTIWGATLCITSFVVEMYRRRNRLEKTRLETTQDDSKYVTRHFFCCLSICNSQDMLRRLKTDGDESMFSRSNTHTVQTPISFDYFLKSPHLPRVCVTVCVCAYYYVCACACVYVCQVCVMHVCVRCV